MKIKFALIKNLLLKNEIEFSTNLTETDILGSVSKSILEFLRFVRTTFPRDQSSPEHQHRQRTRNNFLQVS